MKHLTGLGTALITPFTPNGEVDFDALERLLQRQLDAKVDYIVVLGTTGEAATMTNNEKQTVRRFIVQKINRQLPLVLGLGGNNTAQVIQDIQSCSDELQRDYAAILSVCPYYNKPSQEGLFRHFSAIAEACPIPVILYNVPGRTGVNMLPDTVIRLAQKYHQIIGVKEASGNMEQIRQLITNAPADFSIISGDDGIAGEVMQAGGAGLISVASNAWPREFALLIHNTDRQLQNDLQTRFAEMVQLLFCEGNPAGIKTVLCQMGLISNSLRLPLVPNSPSVQSQIRTQLTTL